MECFLLISLVFSTLVEHLLHFEDIPTASIGANLHNKLTESCCLWVRDQLAHLHGCFSCTLLPQKQKSKSESKQSHEGVIKGALVFLHKHLKNTLSRIFITSTHIDETNG